MAWSKLTRQERGYGWEWERLREKILKRDKYICRCSGCARSGRVLPATHVDHKVSKAAWKEKHGTLDGVDDPSNLQAINVDCHSLKTLLERGMAPRAGCDRNGWPTDPNHPWNKPASWPEPDGK